MNSNKPPVDMNLVRKIDAFARECAACGDYFPASVMSFLAAAMVGMPHHLARLVDVCGALAKINIDEINGAPPDTSFDDDAFLRGLGIKTEGDKPC